MINNIRHNEQFDKDYTITWLWLYNELENVRKYVFNIVLLKNFILEKHNGKHDGQH